MTTTPALAVRVLTGTPARRAYTPARFKATPLPTVRERHVLNRLGSGYTPRALARLRAAGGELAWLEQQLDPAGIREPKRVRGLRTWFPHLSDTPAQMSAHNARGTYRAFEYARDLANETLLRRIYSERMVFENMVELWSNLLHVDARRFPAFIHRIDYDEVIRRHALGRFEDLLVEATLHPAMLVFLDTYRSGRPTPNENHGRELLELHTVGRGAGYTEAMVKDSAKILSGHTVVQPSRTATFDPGRHVTGAVNVLGFSDPNATADNPDLAVRYLRHLAHHPATARRIARRLAVRFVSDDPSDGLVERVAAAYLHHGTDIPATLRALVAEEEFWASAGAKVRTPIDDLVHTCRVLGVKAKAPTGPRSFAHTLAYSLRSTLPYQWVRPDGPPDDALTWASTTRMLNSWRMHWNLAGGHFPRGRVRYRSPRRILPKPGMRFDKLVDHWCRLLLGRRSTARILEAACRGADVAPGERITRRHPVVAWKFPHVVAAILDTPEHMTR